MLLVALLTVGACAIAVYFYLKKRDDGLKRLNLPHPPVKPLFGNMLDFFRRPLPLQMKKWSEEYGKTFAYKEGGYISIVSSDLDVLQVRPFV